MAKKLRGAKDRRQAKIAREQRTSPNVTEKAQWGDVAPDGRLLIPARFRKSLGFDEDGHVLMRIEDGELHVLSRKQALEHARAIVRKYVPPGVSLVDELIAERRAEAAREDEES